MNKQILATIEKAPSDEYDGTFILSTESRDRDGDIILLSGWEIDNFQRNPIALWQHDKDKPVGTWQNLRIEADRLVADLKLASTRLAEMTRQLINDDVLKAVSVGFLPKDVEPRDPEAPWKGYLIKGAELLEASLVSVPANQEALLLSKSLELTDDERAAIFLDPTQPASKSADPAILERGRSMSCKSAATKKSTSYKEGQKMNLSERIKGKQSEIESLRGELSAATEKYADDASDENREVVEGLAQQIEGIEVELKTLVNAESKIKSAISDPAPEKTDVGANKAPALVRSVKNYEPGEIFFKQAAVTALAAITRSPIESVLQDRYRNDKGLNAIMTKADSVIGTTTGTNWAAPLLEESVEGFLDLFTNNSVYGALRAQGMSLNFAGKGSIKIPSRGSTKKPAGAFVGEGAPIPVKEAYFSAQTLTPDKMGVIVPFSEELVTATNGQIESIIRAAIVQDTAETLDSILLDANAASATRPAGLLNGVTATNSAGDTAALITTDVKTLMANFVSNDTPKSVSLVMNGARVLGVRTVTTTTGERAFPEVASMNLLGIPFIESGNADANTVISINANAFYTAYDAPRFSISNTAVLHMEDTTPLEVVSGTGPTTADPVRSLFQTDSMAIRMILPVTWAMVRAGQVDAIDTVTW